MLPGANTGRPGRPSRYLEDVLNRIDLRGRGLAVAADLPRPDLLGDKPVGAVRDI